MQHIVVRVMEKLVETLNREHDMVEKAKMKAFLQLQTRRFDFPAVQTDRRTPNNRGNLGIFQSRKYLSVIQKQNSCFHLFYGDSVQRESQL